MAFRSQLQSREKDIYPLIFFIWMFTSCCEKIVLIMCWLIGFIYKLLIHYIVWLMVYIVFILRIVWYWFIFMNCVFLRDVNLLIIINKAVNGHMTIYNLLIYNITLLKMSRWKIIYFFCNFVHNTLRVTKLSNIFKTSRNFAFYVLSFLAYIFLVFCSV